MADQYVQVLPDSSGKKIQVFENTVGAAVVEAQAVVLVTSAGTALAALPVTLAQTVDSGNGFLLTGTSQRTITVVTTLNSFIVTSAALFTSADLGAAITGTGIPAGAIIVKFTSTSSVQFGTPPNYPTLPLGSPATASGSISATVRAGFAGTFLATRTSAYVRELSVVGMFTADGTAWPADLGGTFCFQYSEDGTTASISEIRSITDFATVRDFDLINAGAYYRVLFAPSRTITASEFVFCATTQRRQNDGAFVRLPNQQVEEANAAMPQTFSYGKLFGLDGKSVNLRASSVSLSNNSETLLTSGTSLIFTGVAEEVTQHKSISVLVAADQAGTLQIQFAKNVADFSDATLVTAISRVYVTGAAQGYMFSPIAQYYRIKFTSNATQTKFRLQTVVHHTALGPIFAPINTALADTSLAQITRAIVGAQKPDLSYINIQADAAGGLRVSASKVITYYAAYRSAAVPNTLTAALTAATTVQMATLHHTAGATKTLRLRRVEFLLTTASATATMVFDLVRITTAPTTGTTITPALSKSTDAAAEAVCLATPTVAGTQSTVVSAHALRVTSSSVNTYVTLFESTGFTDIDVPTLLPSTLEGFALVCRADAAVTITGNVNLIFTEE